VNEVVVSSTLLAVTQSTVIFTALLPEFGDVRKSVGNPDMINDVRLGEIAAGGLVIATGLIATSLAKSPIPAAVSIMCAVGLVVLYESVLLATPKEVKS